MNGTIVRLTAVQLLLGLTAKQAIRLERSMRFFQYELKSLKLIRIHTLRARMVVVSSGRICRCR